MTSTEGQPTPDQPTGRRHIDLAFALGSWRWRAAFRSSPIQKRGDEGAGVAAGEHARAAPVRGAVRPDGRTERIPWRPTGPGGAVSFPLTAPELVVLTRRGPVLVTRAADGRVLWRSRHRSSRSGAAVPVTKVAASPARIAFSVADEAGEEARGRLFVAPIDGGPQAVSRSLLMP